LAKSKNQNLTAEHAENAEFGIIKKMDRKMIQASPAKYHAAKILDGDYNKSAEKAEHAEIGMGKGISVI
jgi:hypothetical protein